MVVLTRRWPGTQSTEMLTGFLVQRAGLPLVGKLGSLSFGLSSIFQLATRFRNYRIVHVQNIDTPLLVGLIMRVLGRKLVATIHGEAMLHKRSASALGRLRLTLMRRYVHRYTAITDEVAAQLRALGIPEGRIDRIPNGVDTESFRPPTIDQRAAARSGLNIDENTPTAVFIGRLISLKQVDLLLRAWKAAMSDAGGRLLIVGGGPELDRLEGLAAELEPPGVEFLGPRDDIRALLAAANLFVLPSRQEGLSMALLEAMATGVPPLVSDLPGHRSVVEHGVNGWLFPATSQQHLEALLRATLGAAQRSDRPGRLARQTVEDRFSVRHVAGRHISLYDELSSA